MCSVNEADLEDGDGNQFMERTHLSVGVGTLCKKCKTQGAEIVLRVKDAYCRTCFLQATTHKFRAALGKSRLLKVDDRVLLAVSPSNSSLALLHLLKMGVNDISHKRLRCSPCAVYIDEGAVLDQTSDERVRLCSDIVEQIQSLGIPAYVSSLGKCLSTDMRNQELCCCADNGNCLKINDEEDEKLKKLFAGVQSLTSRDDLLQKLRSSLLFALCDQLECCKIFVAETGSHLATKLMTNLALGRGAQLPYDISFCDSRYSHVKLLRPLKDMMSKEIAFYNIFNNLKAANCPSLGTKTDPYSSIQKLTEKFIVELQDQFPSTVSNVFRTGEKFTSDCHSSAPENACALCQAPLDISNLTSSALQATEFSRIVSRLGPSEFNNFSMTSIKPTESCEENIKNNCEETCECNCRKNGFPLLNKADVEHSMCYGCRLIIRDMESVDTLPSSVQFNIQESKRFQAMRKEIEDFLL